MTSYLDYLEAVARDDVEGVRRAEESYGGSWMRRGGVGAFMGFARKWDRLEKQLSRSIMDGRDLVAAEYDIFAHAAVDPRSEGVIDDIRDLRRYLLLVEAELRARGINPTHRDNES